MTNHMHTFDLRVTVLTSDDNPHPQPEDFAQFLNDRFTVPAYATYGLDAYNKDAPQLVLRVQVSPPPAKAPTTTTA